MERYDYKTQRLYVHHHLGPETMFEPERAQAGYLLNVLRMKEGANVLLFNGRDGEWLGEICNAGRKSCKIKLLSQTRVQPKPNDLVYIFAPLKKGRLDYMVQKAVEMGAGTLQPVITRYTQMTKFNMDRARANVIEAAEQCGILSVPTVCEPTGLDELLDGWKTDRKIIFADEAARDHDLTQSLKPLTSEKLALLIGPEGGFCAQERERLRAMDYVVAISLGPRILRADTAAVAAMAIVQSIAGDWDNSHIA